MHIEIWDEAAFAAARPAWCDLLDDSRADRLFSSWDWLDCWWRALDKRTDTRLCVLAAHDGGDLVGLAPMYQETDRLPGGLRQRRMQLMGARHRDAHPFRSEHLGFILRKGREGAAAERLAQHLIASPDGPDLIAFDDVRAGSVTDQALRRGADGRGYLRLEAREPSYHIDTRGEFDDYLIGLSASVRRSLYNRRKRLEGRLEFRTQAADAPLPVDWLDQLERWREARWGRPFSDPGRRFRLDAYARLARSGQLLASTLQVDGRIVSVNFNAIAGDTIYFLETGYEHDFDPKVPLGLLHQGFCIEQAFGDLSIARYDMLIGEGRKTDYKASVCPLAHEMISYRLVLKPMLSAVYRAYDFARGRALGVTPASESASVTRATQRSALLR